MKQATFLEASMATMAFAAIDRYLREGGEVTFKMQDGAFVVEAATATSELTVRSNRGLLFTAADAALEMGT